jgi:hypothetical protein
MEETTRMTLIADTQEYTSFVHRRLDIFEPNEVARYVLALQMTIDRLRAQFANVIDFVDVEYREFDRPERSLPLIIHAPGKTEEELLKLEIDLCGVLAPISSETRVSLPSEFTAGDVPPGGFRVRIGGT